MSRKLVVLAGSILVLHVVIAATLQDNPWGFLASNILQNFSAALAAVLCFRASRRGQGLSRPFWLLTAGAMLAWGIGNIGWTYYQYHLHIEPPPESFTRFLFDSQVVFLAMVSFLDPDRDSAAISIESFLDFLQLAIVFSLIYLKLYYDTAIHLDPHTAMLREFKVETAEDLVLVGLAVVQFARARLRQVRTLYAGLIVYLLIYLAGAAISDLHQIWRPNATGTWFDMTWTIPMLAASMWAASWKPAENPDPPLSERKTVAQILTANALYGLAPMVVLVQVAGLESGWRFTRYALLAASILCYAARLGISQFRFESAAQQLRNLLADRKRALNELEFRNVLLSTQQDTSLDGILVVNPNHHIISYNSRFVQMFGIPEEMMRTGSADLARRFVLNSLENPDAFSRLIAYLYEHPEKTSHDELLLKDGRIFDRYSAPMLGADGKHYGRVWYTRDITELKRADEALRESEERLRTVVETAPVGITVLDKDSVVQMCNPAFLNILGLTEPQIRGKQLNVPSMNVFREDGTLCPIEERPSVRASREKKPVLNVVLRHSRSPEQEGKWLLASAWPLLKPDGSVYQVITTLTDITRQKKIEEELRAGREVLMQAQKAARLGCFDWNIAKGTTVWSSGLEELYGVEPGTFEGGIDDWKEMVVPEDLEVAMGNPQNAFKTGEAADEFRILRRNDGEMRWLSARGRVFYDTTGEPVRMVGVNMDVTERKRAEEAFQKSDKELRMILENAATGMILVDASGRIRRVNPAFEKMLGYGAEELETMTFANITHPEDVPASDMLFREMVEEQRSGYRIKKRYVRKDGELRWAWLTVAAMRNDDGKFQYCVSSIEDITQQELAEQSVRQMSAALLRTQEEEQRRIAREVHDSTAQEMTALILHLGALKRSKGISPGAQNYIAECLGLAKQMSTQIRTFSYLLHPPMLSELVLWSALRVFVEEFRSRSRQRVILEIAAGLESNRLDPQCEMALFRFVQEALANVHRHAGSKSVAISVLEEDGCVRASVSDTGRGMPSKILEGINSSNGGLAGVGITGMKERIHQVGGHLEITSNRHGTTVTAVVPARDLGSAPKTASTPSGPAQVAS